MSGEREPKHSETILGVRFQIFLFEMVAATWLFLITRHLLSMLIIIPFHLIARRVELLPAIEKNFRFIPAPVFLFIVLAAFALGFYNFALVFNLLH